MYADNEAIEAFIEFLNEGRTELGATVAVGGITLNGTWTHEALHAALENASAVITQWDNYGDDL